MSPDTWNLTIKPTFLNELIALQPKEAAQVQKKLALLADDPTPDAKTKKQLRHMEGRLHRLRAGDFRVFYTFEHPYISVLALRRRAEDTYDDDLDAELLGGGDVALAAPQAAKPVETWDRWLAPAPKKKAATQLPRAINEALLKSLSVPKAFHAALAAAGTEDELLECPVPQDVLSRVIDAVMSRPIEQVAAQPDLMLSHPDDLIRFREGELLGFFLRLNLGQESLVGCAAARDEPYWTP